MRETLPNRQSIRKRGWDYTAPGWYFVTINTHHGRALFGAVVNGRMVLSAAGRVAEECWRAIPEHFRPTALDAFVIMPNHMHGLLELRPDPAAKRLPTLGDVIGAYKSAVSRTIGRGRQLPAPSPGAIVWHRNYWDVIVRDEKALAAIRHYIRENPRNYQAVMQGGEPRFLGNRALLDLPKVGFLASRGAARPHGTLPRRAGEAVMSSFLSPMERAVFHAGLKTGKPLIWVKPSGPREGSDAAPIRLALDEGRLLIVSPFDDRIEAPSIRRAAWCNNYVLHHSDRVVVGHLNPGGMLACILSEADPELEILYL